LQELQVGKSFIVFKHKLYFVLAWLGDALVDDHLQRRQELLEVNILLETIPLASKIIILILSENHCIVELDVVFGV
jgi:hypothetical protein